MRIKTSKIKKFISVTSQGQIFDPSGFFFSWSRPGLKFNLPPGNYSFAGTAVMLNEKPRFGAKRPIKINWEKVSITPMDTHVKYFDKYRYRIFLSTKHASLPTFGRMFVLCHELAHTKGKKTEKGCDIYAANRMIFAGYNPSQIYACAELLHFSPERQEFLKKYLEKKYSRNGRI